MSLLEKLKKSRESNVTAGDFAFTVRRPTDLEVAGMSGQQLKQGDILERYVTGWSGVKEIDIIPGGDPVPAVFTTELFIDWVADKPDLWGALTEAVLTAYDKHQKSLDDSLKKPGAG